MTLIKLLEIIPNGKIYNIYDGDNCIHRRMERRVQGKTRRMLHSIAGTEEAVLIEQAGISLYSKIKFVKFDDAVHIYLEE